MTDTPDTSEDQADATTADAPSAVDPQTQKDQRRRKVRIEDQDAAFWAHAFESKTGRRILWGILEAAGWHKVTFACGPNGFPQGDATWHALGEKTMADRLFRTWLKYAKAGVLSMLEEHHPDFADARKARHP